MIDPVPPPSEIQIAKGMRGKDYEAFAVVGKHKGKYYLLEYETNRGHDPSWSIATFLRLAFKHNPRRVVVESVAYQRTLSWLLKGAMKEQGRYWVIKETDDKRSKFDKIVDGLNGPASEGAFFIHKDHVEFVSQFVDYPDVTNDDLLEVVALGVAELATTVFDYSEEELDDYANENDYLALHQVRGAP